MVGVSQRCPETVRVLDKAIFTPCVLREQVIKSGKALKNDIALREIAAIYRSDLTLMISSSR